MGFQKFGSAGARPFSCEGVDRKTCTSSLDRSMLPYRIWSFKRLDIGRSPKIFGSAGFLRLGMGAYLAPRNIPLPHVFHAKSPAEGRCFHDET